VDTLELKIKLTAQGMQLTSLIVLCKISSKSLSLSLCLLTLIHAQTRTRARAREIVRFLGLFLVWFFT